MQNRKILKRLAAVLALLLVCAFAFALAQEQEEYRTLEIGCRGEDVTRLKKAMYWLGYFTSDKVSDEYNDVTARRVILFQQNNGLEETGIATPEMQQLLYSGTAIGTDTAPTPSPVPTPAPTPVCPAVTPGDLPQLDESGFLPADSPTEEYVYANEEDGQWIYISKDLSITIRRYWDKLNKNMWFEGDIRCSPEEPLKTYVRLNSKGRVATGIAPVKIAQEAGVVLALSDDHFGTRVHGGTEVVGTIVRNGKIFSDKTYSANRKSFPNLETLAVFGDGSMDVYESNAYTAQEYVDMGAVNVFAFGPILVRDGVADARLTKDYYYFREPRMALGMVEPYHYVLLAVNGREDKYRGVTMDWLADKLVEMGAVNAINLDGGGTCSVVFMGERINHTGSSPRYLHSVIGFGTMEQAEE
ncbi:MAG: phosphodiester glycosidase family protein [Clostridia bacterium]|nr:phosphodiester glycosidase family protein [Clostridia bacterium]